MNVIILILWMLIIPVLVGNIATVGLEKYRKNPVFMWVAGQILLWALFQVICVPFVLLQSAFSCVVTVYAISAILLLLCSTGLLLRSHSLSQRACFVRGVQEKKNPWYYMLWGIFFLLLIFQMVQAVRLAFTDGDDAYYVAAATVAEESDTLYSILPYTGETTGLNARHGLAPFPIWIAFLARLSGIPAVSAAHIAVPLMMIPMAYGVIYLIGSILCGKKGEKLPFYLIMAELLVLFGDYSSYAVERFLIIRSRQGKATLGSIIIPFIFFLLFHILKKAQEQNKVEGMIWLLLAATVTAACLCSTQGVELVCLLLGVCGLCAAVCYRRWKLLIQMFLCCLPAVFFGALYFLLNG